MQRFTSRWKREYLTSLREMHNRTGENSQKIKTGDVVLVHDDCPRVKWRLAVVEDLITGGDGLVKYERLPCAHVQGKRTGQ